MAQKKRKRSDQDAIKPQLPVRRDLLEQCFAQVHTLRDYLLAKLPTSSRLRRRKIANFGRREDSSDLHIKLAGFLDDVLVCSTEPAEAEDKNLRWKQWLSFSQQDADQSNVTISGTPEAASQFQEDIVEFVIWLVWSRAKNDWPPPNHLLCDGFRRAKGDGDKGGTSCHIPGLQILYPNSTVETLKDAPWPHVLALLAKSGESIMIDMLVDCCIFVPVESGYGNYYQLSGHRLSEVNIAKRTSNGGQELGSICRKPSDITLLRSRIFYAKPILTKRGSVEAGFKDIHVLNQCPHLRPPQNATAGELDTTETKALINKTTIMVYIFPRQFKLHNVFTSEVNRKQTGQKFQDYTLRDAEISALTQTKGKHTCLPKIPKRLRHGAEHLVERLQILHDRCSYFELLRHYCPSSSDPPRRRRGAAPGSSKGSRKIESRAQQSQKRLRSGKQNGGTQNASQISYKSVAELACPKAHVSAFCQAALSKVIPYGFWGEGDTMEHNKKMILRKVHHFIKLRRFETMSLHEIAQDLKIVDIAWLQPPKLQGLKTSQTDLNKRYEIFHEFLYYVFESFLIPLIRSAFYVTEGSKYRNQVFYYRHDVWKRVAEPAMAALREKMFEEVKFIDATRILSNRSLGCGSIRLLPKGNKDMRPLMNLRKRSIGRDKARTLGSSINKELAPMHQVLKLEQQTNPSKLGSSMFSVNGIYTKLKDFKDSLGPNQKPLYFAMVDIRGAFDTIPQEAVVELMSSVPRQNQYTSVKHQEIKPAERTVLEAEKGATKPITKWKEQAIAKDDNSSFADRLGGDLGRQNKNTVFIDTTVRTTRHTQTLQNLLKEHITNNLVKVGRKYYRQKVGIPQGSVLSTFLANYFYADLEFRHLNFLNDDNCLLMRLTDDFLLITLDKGKAQSFVETMHDGIEDYGVEVNPNKTLVNFDMEIHGFPVNRTGKDEKFPYCSSFIDMKTLEIAKERDKSRDVTNSLTIDFGRAPGQNFERKVIGAFKLLSHLMYYDTAHNSILTALNTLREAFTETATKMWAYARTMRKKQQPKPNIIIRTVVKVIDVAFILLSSKSRKMRYETYECDIRKGQVALTACRAFLEVLQQKQAGYGHVIAWLQKEIMRLESQ